MAKASKGKKEDPSPADDAVSKQVAAEARIKAATMQSEPTEVKSAVDQVDEHKLYVKVYSAYETYYEGLVSSVSAVNDTGPFDILPQHHNFMTLVNEGEVVIRPLENGPESKLRISRGIMHVRKNKVTLFLNV